MKCISILILVLLLSSCKDNVTNTQNTPTTTVRLRNLVLAYIDSGLLEEAKAKLEELESLLPNESFVLANQGLIALRQNELDLATQLLARAASLAPNTPEIALLQSQVAQLAGRFEEAKAVLSQAIDTHKEHVQLRWELANQLRGEPSQKEHLEIIVKLLPDNVVARLALIKSVLISGHVDIARNHLLVLQEQKIINDQQAMSLFNGALQQIDVENARAARAQVIGLDNVLKPTRAWQHSQIEVAGSPGTIGHPIRNFINTQIKSEMKAKPVAVTFSKVETSIRDGNLPRVLLVESQTQSELITATDPNTIMLVSIDWNNDRKLDVVYGTANGLVALMDGTVLIAANGFPVAALTPWDADQDGDLDLLVSRNETVLLQNNGDGSATVINLDAPQLKSACIIDYDEDGAVDLAAIDDNGQLVILRNERSGRIHPTKRILSEVTMQDLIVGDYNNDGWMDLAWINENGAAYVGINDHNNNFTSQKIGGNGRSLLFLDVDNDTWLDVLVVGDMLQLFQRDELTLTIPASGEVQAIDVDFDGDIDLVVNGEEYAVWHQDGSPTLQFQKVILEAILEGGQRNNSLGVGGFVEVRSGNSYQKRMITGPFTHVGLGNNAADVIRVVWPNGVPQDVIEPAPNQTFIEVQILKGSCPFLAVATDDGWEFVTDLLWRSPLGLKINAQTVPPIAATKDWVKVSSDQLVSHSGVYELAITAQLWETHFIDEVKLVAIDHPIGTEVFVDERFVAPVPPKYQLYIYDDLTSPIAASDQSSENVIDTIRGRDGVRLGGFVKGKYQGIAEDHFVELDLGDIDTSIPIDIIASGWIRPTDTSINVASAQGNHPIPRALHVEVADGRGGWKTVIENGGFPSGKLKTIILELPPDSFDSDDHRVRITTNLEIYWDQIQFATRGSKVIEYSETTIDLLSADLGYMGYPRMSRTNDDAPNIPDYNDIRYGAAWRDLEGFYTRYGAVEPLLDSVDDRYVIMNAGDVIYLRFEVPKQPVADGYTRDFVFFCDGWVKDGDWNTVDSRTVGPLPHHSMSGYPYPPEEAPETLRPSHPDWQEFHTRYITPAAFRDSLK